MYAISLNSLTHGVTYEAMRGTTYDLRDAKRYTTRRDAFARAAYLEASRRLPRGVEADVVEV